MANTVIYTRKALAPLIFEVFSFLQEKNLVVSLFRYATETTPNTGKDGEKLVRLDDGKGHKLTGLFLKASKESMEERNARRAPRWFETPFIVNGQEYYLSTQWNAAGDFQLTLPNLDCFLKECCWDTTNNLTYSIFRDGEEFAFAQVDYNGNSSAQEADNTIKSVKFPKQESRLFPLQKIFFGAPGTGKSYKVNSILAEQRKNLFASSDIVKSNHYAEVLSNENDIGCNVWIVDCIGVLEKKLATFEPDDKRGNPRHSALQAYIEWFKKYKEEQREIRTTFHPDYDYAQFVGAYKPKKVGDAITYSFVPQVFAKAYAAAWAQYYKAGKASTTENQVYLVIEEINRGNCAQIFGDIFQLLDRDSAGFSQYAIDADCDFADWLENNEAGLKSVWNQYKGEVGEGKLKLPPNLNILATMNTSDQSLFPMDSAFKRRFDWEYVPISFDGKKATDYRIDIDDKLYSWKGFVETVNKKILDITKSEDKQLGEFFIKPDKKDKEKDGELLIISKERFLGKVMFYLWNDVCKDEHENDSFFTIQEEKGKKYFTFQDLYKNKDLLKQFLDELLKEEG